MPKPLALRVLTPTTRLLDLPSVAWIQATLIDGQIGIWPDHAPLLAETRRGPLQYGNETGPHRLDLEAGILQIEPGMVSVFTSGLAETGQTVSSFASSLKTPARLRQVLLSMMTDEK